MSKYKIELTLIEKKIFNTIKNIKMRKSLMSIFITMVGNSNNGVCRLTHKEFFQIIKSCKMYSLMLTIRIKKLVAMGLIEVIEEYLPNGRKKHAYKINRKYKEEDIQAAQTTAEVKAVDKIEPLDELEAFYIEEDIQAEKERVIKKEEYNKTNIDLKEAKAITKEILEEKKITNTKLKGRIYSKIEAIYTRINKAGAWSYIRTVVENQKAVNDAFKKRAAIIKNNANKFVNNYFKNNATSISHTQNLFVCKTVGKFSNYPQREYNHAVEDEDLFGWDE